MITDALVNFVPYGSPITITAAGTYRSNIVDLLGSGVGTAPHNFIGNRTVFGTDMGIGGKRPQVEVLIGQVFASGTSLQVLFQGAVDAGSPTYAAGTWTTLVETPAILTASLTAGQVLARFDFPPAFPASFSPRYLSLAFVSVGTFTTGTIAAAPVTMVRDDQANKFMPANYSVNP